MSKRPPNEIESKLHQAILSRPNKRVTLKQVEAIIPEPIARKNALNFLLGAGLLIPVDKSTAFRAVSREEFTQSRDLSEEENTILRFIRASSGEGIWMKHLKSKTNYRKPIIEHCLRSLITKRLIKRVSSVHHTTRKIYMLEGITPSVALTGGPWYTDNELDTHFVRHLTEACLQIIRTLSFPKRVTESTEDALYAPFNAPEYPTASYICASLMKARLTDTELTEEDVTKLLNILILDGEIERIPIFRPSSYDSDDEMVEKPLERSSRKKRKRVSSNDENSNDCMKRSLTRDTEEWTPYEITQRKSELAARTSTLKTDPLPSIPGTVLGRAGVVASDNTSGDLGDRLKGSHNLETFGDTAGEVFVYRAINSEQRFLGCLESPCSRCPIFDFCKPGGPVNPNDCLYFSNWMVCDSGSSEIF